jgi:hypothetical protein
MHPIGFIDFHLRDGDVFLLQGRVERLGRWASHLGLFDVSFRRESPFKVLTRRQKHEHRGTESDTRQNFHGIVSPRVNFRCYRSTC